MPGTLFVVATPIGNLEDITVRALRVLREVALIAAEDTRRTAHLLTRHGISTRTTSLHEHNEATKADALIDRLRGGESIAIVSDAGTPVISDPGARLVCRAIDAGIRVEPIPGPSAVIAALVVSGLTSDSFRFLGFPPSRSKARDKWFDDLLKTPGAAVFFEAPHRIRDAMTRLAHDSPSMRVCICREMTKLHEQVLRGAAGELAQSEIPERGEFTVVAFVGESPENMAVADGVSAGTRREELARVAENYGLTANQLYKAIQQLKNSGE